jgi:hypothetical protein
MAPLLLYGVLACIVTWPLVLHIDTHLAAIPGETGLNVWQHTWNIWWVRESLLVQHTNPYHTDMLFYPHGTSLYLHSLNLPQGILALPLLSLAGIVVSYNLLNLLLLVLAGYCSYLLAHYLVRNTPAAMFAGVVVLCSPLRLAELHDAQLATISDYGVPLTLLAVLVALEHRTWRSVTLVAGSVLLAGLSKWYNVFYLLPVLLLLLLWRIGAAWRSEQRAATITIAIAREGGVWARMALLSALLTAPFLLPALLESVNEPYQPPDDFRSANLLMLLPLPFDRLLPTSTYWRYIHSFAFVPYLLALVGVWLLPRRTSLWAAIALVCMVLSLGPQLLVATVDTGIPMPYSLLLNLPVVGMFRVPYRFNLVTTLMIGVLAALALSHLLRRLAPPHAWGIVGMLMVLTTADAADATNLPLALVDGSVSPFYHRIAAEPGRWSLLELPLDRTDREQREMYPQTYHGKYILTGKTSRDKPRLPYEVAPPIAQVEAADTRTDIVTLAPAKQVQLLRAMRLHYLVVRPDPHHPGRDRQQVAAAREVFGPLTEVYAGADMHAYRLDTLAAWLHGPGTTMREPVPLFLGIGEGWEPLEAGWYGPARWLSPGHNHVGEVWAYTPSQRRVLLDIQLYSLPGARPLEIWLNGEPMVTLPVAAGTTPRHYLTMPFVLPEGASKIELRAPQGGVRPRSLGIGNDNRRLSFNVQHIEIREIE